MKRAIGIALDILFVLVLVAHLIKGPTMNRADFYFTCGLFFAAGSWVTANVITFYLKDITRYLNDLTRRLDS